MMLYGFSVSVEATRGRRYWRRRFSLVTFIVVIGFIALFQRFGVNSSVTVELVPDSSSQVIRLEKRPGQGDVYSLWVRVSGGIDGRADLSLMVDGQAYRTETLSGAVDFEWSQDWYSESAEIHCNLLDGSGGRLGVEYRFRDH